MAQQLLYGISFHPVQLQVAVFSVSFRKPLRFRISRYPKADFVSQLAQFEKCKVYIRLYVAQEE